MGRQFESLLGKILFFKHSLMNAKYLSIVQQQGYFGSIYNKFGAVTVDARRIWHTPHVENQISNPQVA